MKKHIPDSGYDYANRLIYPLFASLSAEETAALSQGAKAFQTQFPETLLFPDPFLVEKKKGPEFPLAQLRIVHGDDEFFRELANELAAGWREKYGVELRVLEADDPAATLSCPGPKLLLGGGDLNPRSFEIARKYQLGVFSSEYPGEGGWGLTTYWALESGFSPCYILTCDAATREEALRSALEQIVAPEGGIRWAHQVCPGSDIPEEFAGFAVWASGYRVRPHLKSLAQWWEGGRRRPYREVFSEFFVQTDFPDGVPYNSQYLDLGIDAIRYYQCTGSEDAWDLFREMLWGLSDYFNSEAPQLYISDMDFRMGLICNYWNWVQHHPSITEAERITFDRVLLGAQRMVRGYYRIAWKDRPGPPHNHQTFKARSLIMGWRYFKDRDLPDVPSWKEDADLVFNRIDPAVFKHSENAGGYETFVPEHTLVWLEATNQTVPAAMKDSLAQFALREWAVRDNFFFPVDYGDNDPNLSPIRPLEVAPWLDGSTPEQQTIQSLEASGNGLFPLRLPAPFRGFMGMSREIQDREFTGRAGRQLVPLDPVFAKRYAAEPPPGEHFDKLVWRSGWKAESAYLAQEGIGNTSVSHAHNEASGILRMNLGGRIWLIRAGYGKRAEIASASEAFSTRQLGPEEHNMLVVRDVDSGKILLPPVNALLQDYGAAPLPFSASEVKDYGGLNWQRYVFNLPEVGFIVCDRVLRNQADHNPYELQWNILGALTPTVSGAEVRQDGVDLVWEQFGTSVPQWEESQISIWRESIQSGAYPHTRALPTRCVQKIAGDVGDDFYINGFWLKAAVRHASWNKRKKELSLTATKPLSASIDKVERPWGMMTVDGTNLKISFGEPPSILSSDAVLAANTSMRPCPPFALLDLHPSLGTS